MGVGGRGAPCCRSRSQSRCPIFHLDQVFFADSDPFAVRSGFPRFRFGVVVERKGAVCHLDLELFFFFFCSEEKKRINAIWQTKVGLHPCCKMGVCVIG